MLLQDLVYAKRALGNSPGFAVGAILSIALGVGANTAIFSVIDAVMLRSLPGSQCERARDDRRADGLQRHVTRIRASRHIRYASEQAYLDAIDRAEESGPLRLLSRTGPC